MSQSNIHPAAIIESDAKIGRNVTIEAYAIIKKNVTRTSPYRPNC